MAFADLNRSATSGVAPSFGARISYVLSAFVAWRNAVETRKALNALSDRELLDIGLERGDIDHVIR